MLSTLSPDPYEDIENDEENEWAGQDYAHPELKGSGLARSHI